MRIKIPPVEFALPVRREPVNFGALVRGQAGMMHADEQFDGADTFVHGDRMALGSVVGIRDRVGRLDRLARRKRQADQRDCRHLCGAVSP